MVTTTTQRGVWRYGKRAAKWLLGGALAVSSGLVPARAEPPTVPQILQFKPRQEGVAIATPEGEKANTCTVEPVKVGNKIRGWILKDAQGNVLRNFFDSNDDNKIDVWSYYKDGKEVYRETDTTFNGKPDQYRWLNDGGSKWGVDDSKDKDGKIRSWKVITPEEVSQEIVAALIGKDFGRLQVLMITDAEMKALDLTPAEIDRIHKLQKEAPAKFNETAGKLKLTTKSTWQNLLTNSAPACVPGNSTSTSGGRLDVAKHTKATIVIDVNDQTHSIEMIQPGEMIQVGSAWRVVGAPAVGAADTAGNPGGPAQDNPKLDALFKKLADHDTKGQQGNVGTEHHLQRADIVEQIIAEVKETDREQWIRQVADSLSSAAQTSPAKDNTAMTRLGRLVEQIVKAMPETNLAAYVTFRQMQAEYALKTNETTDFRKTQGEWAETLAKFVTTYSKADDTPDALLQLGTVNEFLDKEIDAKNWYGQLVKNFPETKIAARAKGAIRRLELDGQQVKLAGPTLKDPKAVMSLEQLRGKYVIVYFWASWTSQSVGDFAKLKLVLDANKDVELVTVNLDRTADEAKAFLSKSPSPGTHLYQDTGMDAQLATDFGITLPPNMFLIGKDGKCITHATHSASVEQEIKKANEKK
jgi:hypothetical protein